jgi:hypothetical protein
MPRTSFVVTGTHCPARLGLAATYYVPLHVVTLHLAVLHSIALTVCGIDRQTVRQRRYCDPVEHRQASQKVTGSVRYGAHFASRLKGYASTPTCRSLPALLWTPPLT